MLYFLTFLHIVALYGHTFFAALKPAAKGGAVTQSQAVFTTPAASVQPASYSFTRGNKKKSAGARSGK